CQASPTSSHEQILEVDGKTPDASFTPQSVFEPVIGFKTVEIDDEMIMIDLLSDTSVRLNSTGTFIWRLILERLSLEEISNQLSEKFKLDFDKAFEIVSAFVAELVKRNL